MSEDLTWILNWYYEHCDGDWEHGNGIKIGTLDNPGWYLKASLTDTELHNKKFQVLDVYRNDFKIWIFDLVKAPRFDLSKQGQYYNIDPVLKVKSRELSLRSKTKF